MNPRILRSSAADEETRHPLLIVGASARAAAFSAIRAGMRPIAADLYGDSDLRAIAHHVPVADYPRGLPSALETLPDAPWIYTGALENHPAIIGRIAERRPLWGNPPDTLRAVRDPLRIPAALRTAGLPTLEVKDATHPPPGDGRWLIKPLRSGGGRGISVWNAANANALTLREPHFFQRWVRGTAISAIFLGNGAGARLLGSTQQFLRCATQASASPDRELRPNDDPAEPGWMYAGGIAPLQLPAGVVQMIESIGQATGAAFGLRGLFGCDFCLEAGTPWLTEINPRYTAAIELLELARSRAFLRDHRGAFQSTDQDQRENTVQHLSDEHTGAHANRRFAAKLILFAEAPLVVTHDPVWHHPAPSDHRSWIADLPDPGTSVASGHPICTVLSTAATADECRNRLAETAADVWHHLTGTRRQFILEP